MSAETRSTYTSVAIGLHWLIALMLIGNLIGGFLHDAFPPDLKGTVMNLHKASGVTVLALSIVRLAWRLTHRPPALAPTVKPWEKGLSHAVHWTFYLLIIALPLSGWLMVSAGERKWPTSWFGLFEVPYVPIAQDKATASTYSERHEVLGIIAAVLVVLHIAAALKHHLVDKDNTLVRMWPGLGKGRQA